MNLNERAMLVKLNIGQWAAKKHDKKISKEVADNHNAVGDVGRYSKHLLAAEALQAVQKAANEARTFHYAQTLPWRDDGARILLSNNFGRYSERMRELEAVFFAAVREFGANYVGYVEDARRRLNGMFDAADYPRDVVNRFSWGVSVDPLPDAADFRAALTDSDVARLRSDIEARNQGAVQAAVRDVWGRVHEVCSAMVDRLGTEDAIFRDSLIGNAMELANLLPRLNLTDDPKLTELSETIKAKLCRHSPDRLRADPVARVQVADDAKAILEAMAGYCGVTA